MELSNSKQQLQVTVACVNNCLEMYGGKQELRLNMRKIK